MEAAQVDSLKQLVGLRDLSVDILTRILDRAVDLRSRVHNGEAQVPLLAGCSIALMFMEPSTRTRFSFERAVQRLGAHSLSFSEAQSSSRKGESLLDSARSLQAVGADAIVLRHRYVGAPHLLASELNVPVVNAGDGINEHPTQGLLDLLTLRDHLGDLKGKTVAIVGDVLHSRVARSNCFALTKLGARVVVAGPGTLCPDDLRALGVTVVHTIDDALAVADALMVLRIQRERIGRSMLPAESEYRRFYGLSRARLAAYPDLLVLHPAPMNRGVEIDDEVADAGQSAIFTQMQNGVFIRMSCLVEVLSHRVQGRKP
jgi:aspartate carbamoyltransferase catalytic subunit